MMDVCQEELVTLAAAFEERLDKMSLDVLGKAEEKAAKAAALLSAIPLRFESKAAALLFDVAAKAREDGLLADREDDPTSTRPSRTAPPSSLIRYSLRLGGESPPESC
jgi:hypothetical protein